MSGQPGFRDRLLQRPGLRLTLAVAWLLALLALGWIASAQLEFSGDLRRFLPDARTPEQRLLMEELGDGPGSRVFDSHMVVRGSVGPAPAVVSVRRNPVRPGLLAAVPGAAV